MTAFATASPRAAPAPARAAHIPEPPEAAIHASSLTQVTRDVFAPLERRGGRAWWAAFLCAAAALLLSVVAVGYQMLTGIGTWGLNRTVGWAFDITNFVFWVGIGHAGTLISAVLLLFRQKWRTSINRSAEAMTIFAAWYSANPYERFALANRAMGPFAWAYWTMMACNVVAPQLLWFRRVRTSMPAVFALSLAINVGMWFERFVIIVTSLHRDYLPSSWSGYAPTAVEVATLAGSFGLFLTLFLLFCRFVPMLAASELKGVLAHRAAEGNRSAP